MAPKRKQRNNKLSNDSMAIDPTEHSVSKDKNGKENTETPFLTQLFDSLSDSKPQSVNIISEAVSPQKNNDMPLDINNKSNNKSPQGSTQTPFLSQLFDRISNSKAVSEKNEHTKFLTKTNSNDQSDLNMNKESKKNEIPESYTESNNVVDKDIEINNAAQLNTNMNSFKQNVQIISEDQVKFVKDASPTPFLSQLFNALDKSSTFSGGMNKKPDNLTSDESLEFQHSKGNKDIKGKTSMENSKSPSPSHLCTSNTSNTPFEQSNNDTDNIIEKISYETQTLKSNFQNKGESSKTTSEAPFISHLFDSLSNSGISNHFKKEPDNIISNKNFEKQNLKFLSENKREFIQKYSEESIRSKFVLATSNKDDNTAKENSISPLSHLFDESYTLNTSVEQLNKGTVQSLKKTSIESQIFNSNIQDNVEFSNNTSEAPFLSQLFNSLNSSSISNQSKKELDDNDPNQSFDKLNVKLLCEGEIESTQKSTKPFLTQLFDTLGNSNITSDQLIDNKIQKHLNNDSNSQSIDSKLYSNSQNQGECSIGNAKIIKDIGTAPFLSQFFDSVINKSSVQETSLSDVKYSSNKVQEQERFLSDVKTVQKKGNNCFRFDRDFYLHQLEIADALEDGNLKKINENLTTGLVVAAKATGHLVGRIYEWIKMSYPNKSELKLSDVSKQLLMMTKIITYFDKTSFSKNEFEEWMTQLNCPYVFPANSKMLWSNVLKNDEFCHKIDPKFYQSSSGHSSIQKKHFDKDHRDIYFFNSSKRKSSDQPFDRPCDQTNAIMGIDENNGTSRNQFLGSVWGFLDDKFDQSYDHSESPRNQSGPTWNQSKENHSQFIPPDRPNTDSYGPSKDEFEPQRGNARLLKHQYGSQKIHRNKLGPSWNQSDLIRNEFCQSTDQFDLLRNQLGPPKDQFGPPSDSQVHLRDELAPPGNQFRPSRDQFGYSKNEFHHPTDQCGLTRDQSIPNRNQFSPQRDEFSHSKGDFVPKRGDLGPPRNEFDILRDGSFPLSKDFGSQRDPPKEEMDLSSNLEGPPQDQFKPSQEILTPDVLSSTLSIEYYSHGQQQGLPLHQTLSNIPPQHIMPPPPGPPPNIALSNISAPHMLGILQTQHPPPFAMTPSNIPYHDVPLSNFPPNGSHPQNVIPYSDIGQPPQNLLQIQPSPQDFTQITVATPSTSYSNVSVPEEWIKAQNLLKSKGDLPSCPPASILNLTDDNHTISNSISQFKPYMATSNQINAFSASQITRVTSATSVSYSSNKNLQTSIQSTKKHKIDIKLNKKHHHDENEESKKSVYICCLPKGLGNEMMKKLLLICGEVEEFHREIIDGIESESCVVKFRDVETVFKSYHLLNEFMILDSMMIVAVLNEKLFSDEDKEIDEKEILESQSAIDLLKIDIEIEIMKQNTECSSLKRLFIDDDTTSKKSKVDEEIYGPDCTDIEFSNLNIDIGKILLVPVLEKCGGVVKWREKNDKLVFKYKNKQSAVIATQLLKELRIPDKYLQVSILSKEAENLELMEIDKGKKNTMKSWLNQAIVANQEEFVNHLQHFCAMYQSTDFDPFSYKTKMCLETKCTGNCESYHIPEKKDRRRDPRIYNYSDVECKNFREGKNCPEGDMCSKSHTDNEREFHESRIHISTCQNWKNTKKKCDKKKLCISAHPETPEVLFTDVWHDLYLCGLHQTYQYLEGSVHNLRNVKMEPGAIYVLVVSPSTFMVRWLTKAIRKLAGRHRLRVEEITDEKTAVDSATIVIGTPEGILKMMTGAYYRSYELSNITCLILDDASLLLHKHFKNMKNILSSVNKYSSKELNKIVVGEKIFQSEVDTLSLLLETKFTVLGDILPEGGFSVPQDMKDDKKKEAKKQRHLSSEDDSYQGHTTGSRNPRFKSSQSRSPQSRSPRSRSPQSKSPRPCYRDHSPSNPRTRYRDQSPCSPRTRYRNHSPGSPRFHCRDYSPDSSTSNYKEHSPNSPRSRYREHSPGDPRSRYKRHSPGSPRTHYRDSSPCSRSPRSRYRDFSPERGGPSRSTFFKYPMRQKSRYPPNLSVIRGPSRYPDHFPKGRGREGPNHCIGPPMEINFPLIDHCYNLRSICDDLGLAGYTLRTIVVKALNLGPNPHRILGSLRDANVFVQMNKEATEFKLLEKRSDNVISEENFKRAYIQTKILIEFLKSTVHIELVDQYGLDIRRIAIETINKNIEYVTDKVKIHLQNVRVTPTPKNVFEILAAVLGQRSVINANRLKGTHHYDFTDMSSVDDVGSDVDDDLEMVNERKAEPNVGI